MNPSEERDKILEALIAAQASNNGFWLRFETPEDLQVYLRKLYVIRRAVKKDGEANFDNIVCRVSPEHKNELWLIKEGKHK